MIVFKQRILWIRFGLFQLLIWLTYQIQKIQVWLKEPYFKFALNKSIELSSSETKINLRALRLVY